MVQNNCVHDYVIRMLSPTNKATLFHIDLNTIPLQLNNKNKNVVLPAPNDLHHKRHESLNPILFFKRTKNS